MRWSWQDWFQKPHTGLTSTTSSEMSLEKQICLTWFLALSKQNLQPLCSYMILSRHFGPLGPWDRSKTRPVQFEGDLRGYNEPAW